LYRRLALITAVALTAPALACVSHAATPPAYSVRAVTITTRVASEGTLGSTSCVIDADLYRPAHASWRHQAPAIMTTNGYGGSKADLVGIGRTYSSMGYVVLAYSSLGFGSDPQAKRRGSDCRITFDDRQHDGTAAKQLVDFLGGLRAADDGTRVDYVVKDAVAHDGRHHSGDPRIGMIGSSYGGQAQFAAAAVDPRIDTLIPMITWNDLAYSLSPNNTAVIPGTVRSKVPGSEKLQWNGMFLSVGLKAGALGAASASTRVGPCPNFSDPICSAMSSVGALGYADAAAQTVLRNASIASYLTKVRVPVLLGQGETDTLFPLREAIATYTALRARHVPVKMVWQHWGHGADIRPGEYSTTRPMGTYEGKLMVQWLDHWLKDVGPSPTMDFSYYEPWRDHGDARQAFVTAPSYPLPGATTLYASGSALRPSSELLAPGQFAMAAPGSAPMSFGEPAPLADPGPLNDLP